MNILITNDKNIENTETPDKECKNNQMKIIIAEIKT
jgi:hypothetical protein